MLPNLGYGELLLVLVVALVVFGPRRIPELGAQLGRAARAFKAALREGLSDTDTRP